MNAPFRGAFVRVLPAVCRSVGTDMGRLGRLRPFRCPRRVGRIGPSLESLCRTTADPPKAPAVHSGKVARSDPLRAALVARGVRAKAVAVAVAGEVRALNHSDRVRGRRPPPDPATMVATTARVEMARLVGLPPTSRARRVRMASRAKKVPANGGRRRVLRVQDEKVVRQRAIARNRVATATMDVAAVRRNVTLGGEIREPPQSRTVSVLAAMTLTGHGRTLTDLAGTTRIARDRMASVLGGTTLIVRGPADAIAYLLDGSNHHALLPRSVRSRSRLLAGFVSRAGRPPRHRGSARSGLTKDRCDPKRARPPYERNVLSPRLTRRLSRLGAASRRTWPPTSPKFCRRARLEPSPRSTGSV